MFAYNPAGGKLLIASFSCDDVSTISGFIVRIIFRNFQNLKTADQI